ncbi:MAG: hypothetical protein M5U26_03335 [Planctomycetota bacterium]|nr:hypothetical protein [Planctomycetota bacterium]
MAETRPWRVAPYLLVGDVAKAAHWYRDRLGFGFERLWGEPPSFAMVGRGGATLMLKQAPGENPGRHVRPNAAVNSGVRRGLSRQRDRSG